MKLLSEKSFCYISNKSKGLYENVYQMSRTRIEKFQIVKYWDFPHAGKMPFCRASVLLYTILYTILTYPYLTYLSILYTTLCTLLPSYKHNTYTHTQHTILLYYYLNYLFIILLYKIKRSPHLTTLFFLRYKLWVRRQQLI